jgi:hypothetical protein
VLATATLKKRTTSMNPNPILNDVVAAFDRVASKNPAEVSIDRSGVVLHPGGHFQGIQWFPDQSLLVITSDSNDVAYFVPCKMAPGELSGRAYAPVTMSFYFAHCGGCQSFGNFLVVGCEEPSAATEDSTKRRTSEVQFWDFRRFPMQLVQMTIPRSGPYEVSTAGAVGMSTRRRGTVLAVATFNAQTVDFYRSKRDPFQGSPLDFQFTWSEYDADRANWIDEIWGGYQNINLLTQRDGQLFLIGTYRNKPGEDWMDLYAVNLGVDPSFALTKVGTKHMYCTLGCDFSRAAGIFIESSDAFKVFATPEGSGDWQDGTTIQANIFNPT